MQVELIEIAPGAWAYRVGHHYQPHDPEFPGHVPMSEDRARALGEALKVQLEAISQ